MWSRLVCLVLLGSVAACDREPGRGSSGTLPPAYVDDTVCAGCHLEQVEEWTGSDHDRAMQVADSQSVLGDFDTSFTHLGLTSRFFMRDGGFFVHTEGPDGEPADFEVAYTFGVDPLQQYLIELPAGRLQALGIAWDTVRGQWFSLYPDEQIRAGDPLHWTGLYQNWNLMCAECHSTGVEKNYDSAARAYDTTWETLDVGCQSCHGPGGEHVERAEGARGRLDAADGLGLVVNLGGSDAAAEVDSCAPCHSRRRPVSVRDLPGEPFLDHFVPVTLDDGLYYPDGQILDEVYVYGSFLQSRMYARGVRCSDCHDPHRLELRLTGDAVCEQCHQPEAPVSRFPTLTPKDYSSPEHHFHPPDSDGARCVGCHMPARTYMVVDSRRDHSFRIPRPDLTVSLGTPNACNGCHADRTADWAVRAVNEWYGPERRQSPHYGEVLAAGRRREPEAADTLAGLALDPESPAIVRATALSLLAAYGDPALSTIEAALGAPDPLVRVTAVGGIEALSPARRWALLGPLLADPVRAVRLEAARLLAPARSSDTDPVDRAALEDLLTEYETVQEAQADTPAANLNLGVLHTESGAAERAVEDYETALELDPAFVPASLNLATLLNGLGRNGDALRVLRDAILLSPEDGELHYSLGLLLAEMGQFNRAVESLSRSADLLPGRARVRYNLGLALDRVGRRPEAEAQLDRAYRLDPTDPSVLQAQAALYAREERWGEALQKAEGLVGLLPGDAGARQFLEAIRRDSSGR